MNTRITKTEIENEVANVISKCLKIHIDDISRSTTPDDVDKWDSLGHITIMLELEEKFQVEFPPEIVAVLNSVGEIADFIMENTKMRDGN